MEIENNTYGIWKKYIRFLPRTCNKCNVKYKKESMWKILVTSEHRLGDKTMGSKLTYWYCLHCFPFFVDIDLFLHHPIAYANKYNKRYYTLLNTNQKGTSNK